MKISYLAFPSDSWADLNPFKIDFYRPLSLLQNQVTLDLLVISAPKKASENATRVPSPVGTAGKILICLVSLNQASCMVSMQKILQIKYEPYYAWFRLFWREERLILQLNNNIAKLIPPYQQQPISISWHIPFKYYNSTYKDKFSVSFRGALWLANGI
jgi:hypothetical protein